MPSVGNRSSHWIPIPAGGFGTYTCLQSSRPQSKSSRWGGLLSGLFFDSLTCQQLPLHNDDAGKALEKGSGKRRAIETIFNWTAAKSCMVQGKTGMGGEGQGKNFKKK